MKVILQLPLDALCWGWNTTLRAVCPFPFHFPLSPCSSIKSDTRRRREVLALNSVFKIITTWGHLVDSGALLLWDDINRIKETSLHPQWTTSRSASLRAELTWPHSALAVGLKILIPSSVPPLHPKRVVPFINKCSPVLPFLRVMFYDITTNTELEELDHGYESKYRVRFLYAFGYKVLVNPTIQNLVLCLDTLFNIQ